MKSELLNKLFAAGIPADEALAILGSPVWGETKPHMSTFMFEDMNDVKEREVLPEFKGWTPQQINDWENSDEVYMETNDAQGL